MTPMLKVENVTKTKNKKKLVDDVSFEVMPGEVFGFLGPNGAGKTTIIKMITGLYKMSSGEIYINGKSIKTDFEAALSDVGAIIENPEMYGYLSGLDNLRMYAKMVGGISEERIAEVVALVKLEKRIDDKVKKYSLGMRQRLGLAQALLHDPKLIILDVPTNGLDPIGIKDLRIILKELCREKGVAVLVSSHLLNEMEVLCDRFGVISEGKFRGITMGSGKNIYGNGENIKNENMEEYNVSNFDESRRQNMNGRYDFDENPTPFMQQNQSLFSSFMDNEQERYNFDENPAPYAGSSNDLRAHMAEREKSYNNEDVLEFSYDLSDRISHRIRQNQGQNFGQNVVPLNNSMPQMEQSLGYDFVKNSDVFDVEEEPAEQTIHVEMDLVIDDDETGKKTGKAVGWWRNSKKDKTAKSAPKTPAKETVKVSKRKAKKEAKFESHIRTGLTPKKKTMLKLKSIKMIKKLS